MSHMDCATVREYLPDLAADRIDSGRAVEMHAHLDVCDECSAELTLLMLLLEAPVTVPDDLAERVVGAVRFRRRAVRRPWWGISAAAVAALALGIGVSSQGASGPVAPVLEYATEAEETEVWLSDDGLLAGAPAIDDLSDEALMELLDELASEGAV